MTAKDYLAEICEMKAELRNCREQAKNCHISYSSLTGIDYSKDRIQSSPRNALEEAAWKMLQEEEDVAHDIERLTCEINKRLRLINKVTPTKYADFLYRYYYENKNLKRIASETGYKIGYLKNLHTEALKAFEACINMNEL